MTFKRTAKNFGSASRVFFFLHWALDAVLIPSDSFGDVNLYYLY